MPERNARARPRTECRSRAGTAPLRRRDRRRTGRRASAAPPACLRAPSRRRSRLMASCAIGWRAALPTLISSAPGRACFNSRGGDQLVVNDDIGAAQALEPVHGDEPGVAGAGANQIDGRILHGCSLVSLDTRWASARIVSAPRASSASATRTPTTSRLVHRAGRRWRARLAAAVERDHDGGQRAASRPSTVAYAPIGIWHPPPSRVTTARSAVSATPVSAS